MRFGIKSITLASALLLSGFVEALNLKELLPGEEHKKEKKELDDKDVMVLTDDNFDQEVLQDYDSIWLVDFYHPKCPHCKHLAPEWSAAATELKDDDKVVKFGKVDVSKEKRLHEDFGIEKIPTIFFWNNIVPKTIDNVEEFTKGRKADEIIEFAKGLESESDMASYYFIPGASPVNGYY